jgi:hypothetical protein
VLELADIFRAAGEAYRARFGARLLPSHLKAMRAIEACPTAALGGHLRQCDTCGAYAYSYHSCGNRHCPKCQGERTHRWLERQRARLLPCAYYLLTFTLPAQLRAVAQAHQKRLYGLLLRAAAQAVVVLAADPRYLGARPGVIAVLHTWTRALLYHPHAHLLVTAGGLTPDEQAWRFPRHRDFLVPGRVLSVLFRATVREAVAQAGLLPLVPPKAWRRRWVVHVQPAGSGQQVLEYLARYLFRVALANSRLDRFEDGAVTFRYRESGSGELHRCRLPAPEFIRRFLQHVLPRGLTMVRAYGLYSPTCRAALERARALVRRWQAATGSPDAPRPDSGPAPGESADPLCPACQHGRLLIVQAIPRPLTPASARDPP